MSLFFHDLLADYNNAKKLIGWLSQDALRLLEEYQIASITTPTQEKLKQG